MTIVVVSLCIHLASTSLIINYIQSANGWWVREANTTATKLTNGHIRCISIDFIERALQKAHVQRLYTYTADLCAHHNNINRRFATTIHTSWLMLIRGAIISSAQNRFASIHPYHLALSFKSCESKAYPKRFRTNSTFKANRKRDTKNNRHRSTKRIRKTDSIRNGGGPIQI